MFAFAFLLKNKPLLDQEGMKARFDSLYLNVRTDVKYGIMILTISLLRRLLYALIVTLAGDYFFVQITLQ